MRFLVAGRYAQALVDISFQVGAVEIFRQELQYFNVLFDKQRDLKFFLLNPEIKAVVKKEVIRKLFSGRMRPELVNFLLLLTDKGRMGFLPAIAHRFGELADRRKNVLNMTVVSAAPLEEAQISDIKNSYVRIHKAFSSKVKVEIDSGLIGGIKVIIGDSVADGSIRGRIVSLKEVLMG